MEFDKLSNQVIGLALKVHSVLGAGLFESVYKAALVYELRKIKFVAIEEVPIRMHSIAEVHKAQLLTYLRLSNIKVGLLINFNTAHLREEIFRMVNMIEYALQLLLAVSNALPRSKSPAISDFL